jgi:hypothetical protein
MATDSTTDGIAQSLIRLDEGRFIGLDRLSGEVLVRSFIRWDGGYLNPKRRPVIARAIEEVRSERLLGMLAAECRRAGVSELMPDGDHAGLSDDPGQGGVMDQAEPVQNGVMGDEPEGHDLVTTMAFPQVECLPGSEPGSEPGSRKVITTVSREDTTTHNPQPSRRAARRDAADTATDSERLFDEFWALYPRKIKKLDGRKAWATTVRGTRERPPVDPQRLVKAIRWQATQWHTEGREMRFVPHPGTWLRSGAYDDEPEAASHLALVPGAPVMASFEDYRANAAGLEAARLLGIGYLPREQPPRDDTPKRQWDAVVAVEWIDKHEPQIRAALTEKGETA